jgi:hypothetical protein
MSEGLVSALSRMLTIVTAGHEYAALTILALIIDAAASAWAWVIANNHWVFIIWLIDSSSKGSAISRLERRIEQLQVQILSR